MSGRVYVEELIDDVGDHFGAYCKGHVDKEAFCLAYIEEFENDISAEDVEHILARKIPTMRGKHSDGWRFCETTKPGRGVFKATIVKWAERR